MLCLLIQKSLSLCFSLKFQKIFYLKVITNLIDVCLEILNDLELYKVKIRLWLGNSNAYSVVPI